MPVCACAASVMLPETVNSDVLPDRSIWMTSTSSTIVAGSQVTLHFSLALPDGGIIDSNFDKKPASFRLGDGQMLPGFEQVLLGLCTGEKVETTLEAKEAFGERNPRNEQVFPLEKFEHLLEDDLITTQVGSVVSFKDAGGFDLPGVVKAIGEKTVSVDFNHPLAGKAIVFTARIVSVLPPEEQVVEVKLS
jgi:FKBP-type peptidyl-prolyl cis-trans isomerase SlpA